ncbi:hypothetical protein SBOR_8841 [Sclerotinia borealis F-4128]|uniref:Uncharacterized protein n=1 Tax=Sclerotinia borealis (strain F-4128) TaxID=1432307 RepID=W9C878_SCLBF|nr:hypothetical protein SBOR_8841 [Sclerotinia borealis F-4128]
MCKTTHTHFTCRCTHLIVHSCALDFPLGRLVCPPPHLVKKDIYVYADCDDCLVAFSIREERAAKKASERWMSMIGEVMGEVMGGEEGDADGVDGVDIDISEEDREEIRDGDMVEIAEGVEIQRGVGCGGIEEGEWEGEVFDMEMELERDLRVLVGKYEAEADNETEDSQLETAQLDIQNEIDQADDDTGENDDIAAAAQLLAALGQVENSEMITEGEGEGEDVEDKDEDEDREFSEHVQTIMKNLRKLRRERRDMHVKIGATDIERQEEARLLISDCEERGESASGQCGFGL